MCFVQLQSEVEKPLLTFRENFKKDMKRYEHHIADLRKQLGGRHASLEKVTRNKNRAPQHEGNTALTITLIFAFRDGLFPIPGICIKKSNLG